MGTCKVMDMFINLIVNIIFKYTYIKALSYIPSIYKFSQLFFNKAEKFYMEPQSTLNSQRNFEQEGQNWKCHIFSFEKIL